MVRMLPDPFWNVEIRDEGVETPLHRQTVDESAAVNFAVMIAARHETTKR